MGVIPCRFESGRPHQLKFWIVIAMTDSGKPQRFAAAAMLAASLAACTSSGSTDETVGRFLVAPGGFALLTCAELAERATANVARRRVLEGLMVKAGTDAGGRIVGSMAYRPEYLERRGEMVELRRVAAEKNCKFVPGADNPRARASDNAIR